jgi:PPK2 family polyphosphate:nucleotide phosphotransferase
MPPSARLKRVRPNAPVHLRDPEARPPENIPKDKKLDKKLDELTERLKELQRVFHADRRYALLIVLQGLDASGKDGTIRRVIGAFNPQGCRVTSFKAPTEEEKAHDFLWRIHPEVPKRGMVGVFNRSHYEDVVAVRVQKLAPPKVWSARIPRINEFEHGLADAGVIIRKFFLHISRDEQRERLLKRITNPDKNWKFRPGDLDDRAKWAEYTRAYCDTISRTSTAHAPWLIVPADDKKTRDYLIARELTDTLESLGLRYPPPDPSIRKYTKVLGKSSK